MPSPLIRAACGCVVLPLGRPSPRNPTLQMVVTFWACDANTDPYGVRASEIVPAKLSPKVSRPLTEEEEDELLSQVARRCAAGYHAQTLASALQCITDLRQGQTDASPTRGDD